MFKGITTADLLAHAALAKQWAKDFEERAAAAKSCRRGGLVESYYEWLIEYTNAENEIVDRLTAAAEMADLEMMN